MTLRKEIEWAVKSICFGAIEVIEGIPKFFIFLYAFAESIGTYLAYGLGMIIGRAVLLATIPFILRHSDIFLDIVNYSIVFFEVFVDALIVVIDAGIEIAHGITDLINSLSRLFSGHKLINGWSSNLVHLIDIKTISRQAFKRFLIRIETNCPAYDSAGEIFEFVSKSLLGPVVCPFVRYLYPARPVYTAADAVLGWTYQGSAEPTPYLPGTNCELENADTADYVCVGLGLGFIVIEVFIPMILSVIILLSIGNGLYKLFAVCLWASYRAIEFSAELVLVFLKRVEL